MAPVSIRHPVWWVWYKAIVVGMLWVAHRSLQFTVWIKGSLIYDQIATSFNTLSGWWCILKNDEVRQWEGWHPIYEMENKSHVWNHQPVINSKPADAFMAKHLHFGGFNHNIFPIVSTPLKNMSSSVGIIIPNIWKVINSMVPVTTNRILLE